MRRWSAALLVFGLIGMAFCSWSPGAMADPTDVWIEESPFTGSDTLFVPTEEIKIHIEGVEDDIYVVKIVYDPWGTPTDKRVWPPRTVPASEELIYEYEIPAEAASIEMYVVEVWNDDESVHYWMHDYYYSVTLFDADIEVERYRYIAGERVEVYYMCWYVKDHSPVDDGYIEWLILDPFNVEFETGAITISDSADAVGTFSFNLGTGAIAGTYDVYFWLNDTDTGTPDHIVSLFDNFRVEVLEVFVSLDKSPPAIYAPGESVRVLVTVRIDGQLTGGAEVDIIVREEGDVQDQYGADDLITKSDGQVVHFFTLATNIDDDTEFEVEAEAKLEDVTISEIVLFTVEEVPVGELRVSLKFDKNSYLSGETITATAEVQTTGTTTADVSYRFWVRDWNTWDLLDWAIQDTNIKTFAVPSDFEGLLWFSVDAKNSEGFEDSDSATVSVAYGYLLVDADPKEYEAGDTITVSFELVSNIMTSPSFFYTVEAAGLPIESGPAGADEFTFDIPSIPASSYVFRVSAVDEGYVVMGSDTARELAGFFMTFEFDKEAYSPGDTMTISYEIKARGVSTLPGTYSISYYLWNGPSYSRQTADVKGELKYKIPDGINEGYQLFTVYDGSTGAGSTEQIYVKSGLNPFWWARAADIPLMSILLLILVIILFILVLRPRGPPKAEVPPAKEEVKPEEPAEEPVPEETSNSPLVINCKACGAPIELTTSKRPLEVMCPSCGETEMVQ
jgi:hypothetical protein